MTHVLIVEVLHLLNLLVLIITFFVGVFFWVLQVGTEISFKLPLSSSSSFESMFREIEQCMRRSNPNAEARGQENDDNIGVESYGISVTTLEEVFLRVAGGDFDEADCFKENNSAASSDSNVDRKSVV